MKSASVLSFLVAVSLIGVGVACTKTVTRVVPNSTDAGSDGGKVTTKPSPSTDDDDATGDDDDTTSSSSSSSSSSGSTTPKPADCKKKTNQTECATCCAEISPKGYKAYQAEVTKCVCADDVCKPDCKTTLCATTPKNPDSTCQTCFQGAQQTCGEPVLTACQADADCTVFNDCLNTASCQTKPAQ